MLFAANLGKRFGKRWIFRNVSFEAGRGEALVVVGHNGVGKSTLLKCLVGLMSPSEGRVTFPGEDARSAIGYASVEQSLYGHLTAREHLGLFARMRGCPARDDELADKVGLREALDRFVGEFSTGMKGRLRIALAVQPEPSLLVLDEPGAGLDEAGRDVVQKVCEEQRARGVLVVATNDPLERRFGDLELELAG
ncbi:MAG: ABC transporter ATP-binding protein [Fimbriimonadaceae bacterium]|nr:ABC transporter ATP-binding protein [Fimbriimonadaceae bacterium]